MRRKKKEKLEEEKFWNDFFYFNIPAGVDEVPAHLERVNFRRYNVNDTGILRMVEYVRSIYQLDLDETDITNESIRHLSQLEKIQELRLKNCTSIDDGCLPDLYNIKGLELLHLGGTSITAKGLKDISRLTDLRLLLISASEEETPESLINIALSLPPGCEFLVNHKLFEY